MFSNDRKKIYSLSQHETVKIVLWHVSNNDLNFKKSTILNIFNVKRVLKHILNDISSKKYMNFCK